MKRTKKTMPKDETQYLTVSLQDIQQQMRRNSREGKKAIMSLLAADALKALDAALEEGRGSKGLKNTENIERLRYCLDSLKYVCEEVL